MSGSGAPSTVAGGVSFRVCAWPGGAPGALAVTHDIDLVHDRELFRWLGELGNLRRHLRQRRWDAAILTARRLRRLVLSPRPIGEDILGVLALELKHGFRGTYFFLLDRYWRRHGSRYRIDDPVLAPVVSRLREAGCELALHGSYYDYSDRGYLRAAREKCERAFRVEVVGVRNHHLRFAWGRMWEAQESAGFRYDASLGLADSLGPPMRAWHPFACVGTRGQTLNLLELPLALMDVTAFRSLGLDERGAAELCDGLISEALAREGLLVLLWHNNYFGEEEYGHWFRVLQHTLGVAAAAGLVPMTCAEVTDWWSRRSTAEIITSMLPDGMAAFVRVAIPVRGLSVEVISHRPGVGWRVACDEATRIEAQPSRSVLTFAELSPGDGARIIVQPSA